MTLPSQAFLVIGLLLTSAEALADNETQVSTAQNFRPIAIGDAPRTRPAPRQLGKPGHHNIRSAYGKRPVDVLSLSMGGALACFFALAMIRRRRSASMRPANLPQARVLNSGEFQDPKPSNEK